MTHSTTQGTPQWIDDCASYIAGMPGLTRQQYAAIIARHAPIDVTRSRNEYREKFDAAFAEKIAAQNRIAVLEQREKELKAENARLREVLFCLLASFTGPSDAEPDRMQCDCDKSEYESICREFGFFE